MDTEIVLPAVVLAVCSALTTGLVTYRVVRDRRRTSAAATRREVLSGIAAEPDASQSVRE